MKNTTVNINHNLCKLGLLHASILPEITDSFLSFLFYNYLEKLSEAPACSNGSSCNIERSTLVVSQVVCVACATDAPGTRGAYLHGTYAGRELRTFVRLARPVHDSRNIWQTPLNSEIRTLCSFSSCVTHINYFHSVTRDE